MITLITIHHEFAKLSREDRIRHAESVMEIAKREEWDDCARYDILTDYNENG